MSIRISIHPMLHDRTGGNEVVEVQGSTVGEILAEVFLIYPELKTEMMNTDGNLKRHFDIFINTESAWPDELEKPVRDGDEISIIMMVVGG